MKQTAQTGDLINRVTEMLKRTESNSGCLTKPFQADLDLDQIAALHADKATAKSLRTGQSAVAADQVALAAEWIATVTQRAASGTANVNKAVLAPSAAVLAHSQQVEGWNQQAATSLRHGRYEEALACTDYVLKIDRANAAAWRMRGQALEKLEQWMEAAHSFKRATVLVPQDAEAWAGCGRSLVQLDMPQEALASMARALQLVPHNYDLLLERARLFYSEGMYTQALASYERAARLNCDEASIWTEYGNCLSSVGKAEAALDCFERAAQIEPTDAHNWIKFGNLLCQTGRYAESISSYNTALELAPQLVDALLKRAEAYFALNNHAEAIKSYQQALLQDSDNMLIWSNLAHLHLNQFLNALRQDQVALAKEHWHDAVKCGRRAKIANWAEAEEHYLKAAAALGYHRLVKTLISRLEGNQQLAPLQCALDFILTKDKERMTSLPNHIRRQVDSVLRLICPLPTDTPHTSLA